MGGCYSAIIGKYRKIFVPVLVAPSGRWENGSLHSDINHYRVDALVDTGATGCAISPELAKMLKIDPQESLEVISADRPSMKNLYFIDMRVLTPYQKNSNTKAAKNDFKEFRNVEVVDFYNKGKPGMLLGMDIILEGSLEIRGKENTFTFCL